MRLRATPAGAAEEDRQLVAHQFATTGGKDGRPVGQTYPVLLAVAGRRGRRGDTRRGAGSGIYKVVKSKPVLRNPRVSTLLRRNYSRSQCPSEGSGHCQASGTQNANDVDQTRYHGSRVAQTLLVDVCECSCVQEWGCVAGASTHGIRLADHRHAKPRHVCATRESSFR